MSRQWLKLDNAALIFPAIRRARWVNVYRVGSIMKDDVDPEILQQAVDDLKPRWPSMYVRLGAGLFWYFLEEVEAPPRVRKDYAYPLTHMSSRELRKCCFRVLYYKNRIAVEVFHSLADGSGGVSFVKSLTARYVELRYGVTVPEEDGVITVRSCPTQGELEDSFLRAAGPYSMSRKEANSVRLRGTFEPGFIHLITGYADTKDFLNAAHERGVTVTAFVCAVMTEVIIEMQNERVPKARQKPVKMTVPVNLRNIFGGNTLRNFALPVNPGVDPRLGDYTLEELCAEYSHQLAFETTRQRMAGRIAANVNPQKFFVMRVAPLFLKKLALKIVYNSVGESKGCLNITNIGRIRLPAVMEQYVEKIDFFAGVQLYYPNNLSMHSYKDKTCITMIRNIREAELERRFFSRLVELGIPITIDSN